MTIQFETQVQLMDQLKKTAEETLGYFDLPESKLALQYAPGKWTIRQLLHHLADAETVLYDRIRRVISKPDQVIWAFDQDAWCSGLDYTNTALRLNRDVYSAIRQSIIYLAEQYYTSKGAHGFVHSQTGKRTLKAEFDKVAWHNAHHLRQIRQALHSADSG